MLARIQAVQQDAEEREIHDRSVMLWLAELRGVAYQAEDVLDEFYYEVLRSIVESGDAAIEAYHRDGGTKRKFSEMYTSSSLASYSVTITKASIPYGMAEKIKSITERFEEISNARKDLYLREEDGTRLVMGPQIRPPTSSHVDERATFGREEEKEEIISLLDPSNGPDFMVLPIVGMGGFGKTTLAQLVFNDRRIHGLFNKRCWVSVSEDFDLVRLTKAIIDSLSENREKPCEFSELNILQDIIMEKIRDHGLFLVLDDVWNEKRNLWDLFKVGFLGAKFVRILTTTRNTSVAKIMQTTSPFQLSSLPEENCWSLFKHFAFGNRETSENANLHEIGRGIVKKCKGSPLAIKALGGSLRYEMDEEKWREILESDISEIDETGEIMPALLLSYKKLPQHLKPCFLYLSMFPKDTKFERDMVVRLWMAQGYINGNTRNLKPLEKIGNEYFDELQGRSLVDGGPPYFILHDLIHDLARSVSQESYLPVLENDQEYNGPCKVCHLYFTKQDELLGSFLVPSNYWSIRTFAKEFLEKNFDFAIFSKIACARVLELRHSSLSNTVGVLKHLRYLSIKDNNIEILPESLCLLYHLQTLDMDCHNILELPESIKTLINLRFLRLYSGKIKQLPESISLLHNLDTLSMERCDKLEKIPESIEQLTNLRVLKVSEYSICYLPSGIGKLTNLITFSGHFQIMRSDMTRVLGEFRDMNWLSGLMSISGLKNIGNIEYCRKDNHVSKLNLRKLWLNFGEGHFVNKRILKGRYKNTFLLISVSSSTNAKNEIDEKLQEGVLESLQPHGNLTELVILNYGGRKVPSWLLDPSLMSKLTTLTLHFHMELTFLPPFLGQLLHLKFLKICWSGVSVRKGGDKHLANFLFANDSSKQPAAGVSFSSREKPSLNSMVSLGEGQAGDKPYIKKLIINNCPKLWKVTIPQMAEELEVNACGCQEIKFSSYSELKRLSISNCRELITIYYESGDLPFLDSISISGCPKLPMLSAIPQELKQLDIGDFGFPEINFPSLLKLQKISIFNSQQLVSIYCKSGDLPFLERISLSRCPNLSVLPTIPHELKQLDIADCGFQEINFTSLSKLQKILIFNCRELVSIYYKIGDLPFLESISLFGCPKLPMLSAIPQELKKLHIGDCVFQEINFSSLSKLQKISIFNCRELISIYYKIEDLPFLESISLSGCPNLSMLPVLPQQLKQLDIADCGFQEMNFSSLSKLQKISIFNCRELVSISYKIGDLPFLESISLSGCPNLSMLSVLPQELKQLDIADCGFQEINFSSLSKLQKISIFNCRELVSISYKIGDLPFLESVSLSRCPNLLMPPAIPQELKQLYIEDCGIQEINFSSLSKLQKISIFSCREIVSIYYKIGDLPFLRSISLSGCPKLLIFSGILEEMKQMDKRNRGFQSEVQNVSISDNIEFIPPFLGRVYLFNCPKLRIFSAIPAVELDKLTIIQCGIREFILPSRCQLLEIHNCPELISVHWRDGDSSSLPLVKFVDCPQLKLLKIPKEVKVLKITSCGTHEIFFSSKSEVQSVDIYGCPELFLVHWLDANVPFLKDLFFEGCPELISLPFLLGDLPLLENFAIKYCPQFHEVLTIPSQLKEFKIVDCCFPEIHLLPQSKLRRLIISECANLTVIKGLQAQFPTGDVLSPMMERVEIRNCPRMDFGTQGNSYFYQRVQSSNLE